MIKPISQSIPNSAPPYHKDRDVTTYLDYQFFTKVVNAEGSMASTLSDMRKVLHGTI
ncbi:hypothetical protein P700755_001421 [Psychroflexus torquis ATCC 700755]|uniref:Uncharacterized protein n=1 Tax=Psychroflexus torquis (strain ATCC 700755 / CIP 106069 / ACAM 623) TaxID=313595 RepID=K4ICL1_PSYTT|nr:hypothetical protein [Psychroflexus torquis]AFU68337.1 hypothetical protein P700755_001421 [Psychroflexus torquis ATCC 700755]